MKKFLKFLLAQKGQTLVLYALLVPLMFMVGGAGVDLGWYYFNKARLQNIADAAVIAGGKALVNPIMKGELTDYTYNYFLSAMPPKTLVTESDRQTDVGDKEAKYYIRKNLSGNFNWNDNKIHDDFNNSELNFKRTLYKRTDDSFKPLYYEIELTEKHQHLFDILNSFDDSYIVVTAAAKFTHVIDPNPSDPNSGNGDEEGPTIVEQMDAVKASKVYANFDVIQNEYKLLYDRSMEDKISEYLKLGYTQKDAETAATKDLYYTDENKTTYKTRHDVTLNQARSRTIQTEGNWWYFDKLTNYRTENSTLRGEGGLTWKVDQYNIDDLFIDFKVDITYSSNFQTDWDIGITPPKGMGYSSQYNHIFDHDSTTERAEVDPKGVRNNYRIHSLICIERDRYKERFPYQVRKDMGKEAPDPLFARIENEQVKRNEFMDSSHNGFNSVHQIIINVKYPNDKDDDRPIVFFYDGPEKIDENSHVRDSQPVILNMMNNFKGVLYAPNSPVVIVGHGNKFEGFIVAKEFRKLKSADEFVQEGYKKFVRKDNDDEIFVKEEDIKSADTVPTNGIELKNYSGGEQGKVYYIEKDCEYFTKVTKERVKSRENYETVPEMYLDPIGNVQLSDVVINADTPSDYKPKYTGEKINIFSASTFGLSSSVHNSFMLFKMVNNIHLNNSAASGILDNMFTYERGSVTY